MIPEARWNLDISQDALAMRQVYENSLFRFARYINPGYLYGEAHDEVFTWLSRTESTDERIRTSADYQLLMLPRGHLKSHCLAVWVTWKITKEPWTTGIYLTAGEDLATAQMSAIKAMFLSDEYTLLWPEMFEAKETSRSKWSTWKINSDHPVRKERRIRDWTLIIKTTGSSATGLHCDFLCLDDVVTKNNAYTESGRKGVEDTVADFAAIKNTNAVTKAAGTRYDEKDLYGRMIAAEVPILNMDTGEEVGKYRQWQVLVREVEDDGNGLGHYLWPKAQCPDTGRWFGFDFPTLVKKKAEFLSFGTLLQYFSQYYNNPNKIEVGEGAGFHYYARQNLSRSGDSWYYLGKKLTVTAGMDLAWTDSTAATAKRADYTAMVVIGVDEDGFIYLLDVTRFKTDKFSVYFRNISKLYDLWRFRKLFIEKEGGGKLIVTEMETMAREGGLNLVIAGQSVPRSMSKEERAALILEPKYESHTILHYKGGVVADLELEISLARPKNDDMRDALVTAVQNIVRAVINRRSTPPVASTTSRARFGGRRTK